MGLVRLDRRSDVEAVNLLSSEKFSEKQTGYLAMGLFLNETHEMVPLIINSMLNDLTARTPRSAMSFVGSIISPASYLYSPFMLCSCPTNR